MGPRTFELVGMPGVGKSTVTPLVRARLEELGLPVDAPVVLPPGEAEELVRSEAPGLWSTSRRFLDLLVERQSADGFGSPQELYPAVSDMWFSRLHGARAAQHGRRAVFFEESMVHEIWRTAFILRDTPHAEELVLATRRAVPRSSLVIQLEASAKVREARVRGKRVLGPVNKALAEAGCRSALWREQEARYAQLARRAARFPWRLVRIDNSRIEDRDRTVRRIVAAVAHDLGR